MTTQSLNIALCLFILCSCKDDAGLSDDSNPNFFNSSVNESNSLRQSDTQSDKSKFAKHQLTECIWVGLVENSVMGRVRVAFRFPTTMDYYELIYWNPKEEYPTHKGVEWHKVEDKISIKDNFIYLDETLGFIYKDDCRLACYDNGSFNGNIFRISVQSISDWIPNRQNKQK